MKLKATEVFTPGAFPQYTYVERAEQQLEQMLKDALETPGQLVSLAGPSKSGKTVLVEKVVGQENLISISGIGIQSPADIWEKVLSWMGGPTSVTSATQSGREMSAAVTAKAKTGILGFIGGEASATGAIKGARTEGRTETYSLDGLSQVKREIANSEYVVLVDDFHYMHRDIQAEAAKALKEAVRLGIKICTAAVLHRGDDIIRANPELRGRVSTVDLKYWKLEDLRRIGEVGFEYLKFSIDQRSLNIFAREAAGSPQLMQQICLQLCFIFDLRITLDDFREITLDDKDIGRVLDQASSTTDFRSLIDVLDEGPKTRGTERKIYKFKDDTSGDVYRCVLKSIANDPPVLSFPYEDLLARTESICNDDVPVGSSVTGTCVHLAKLALDKFPAERVIDWDESKQILDMPDPYLLFYLRWSGRLKESN